MGKKLINHNFKVEGILPARTHKYAEAIPVDRVGVRVLARTDEKNPGLLFDCVNVKPCTTYTLKVWGWSNECKNAYLVALDRKGRRISGCPSKYLKLDDQDENCRCKPVCLTFCTGPCDCDISVGVLLKKPTRDVSKFVLRRVKLTKCH